MADAVFPSGLSNEPVSLFLLAQLGWAIYCIFKTNPFSLQFANISPRLWL